MAGTKTKMALSPLLDVYLPSCRIEGKSSETVRSYKETLGVFVRIVADEGLPADPGSFTTAHVYQFLGSVADTGVSAMTQGMGPAEMGDFVASLV